MEVRSQLRVNGEAARQLARDALRNAIAQSLTAGIVWPEIIRLLAERGPNGMPDRSTDEVQRARDGTQV